MANVADLFGLLSWEALDQRFAIVGTSGSGKTYTAKGMAEQLLSSGARVCIVDPLGVWWGLRAGADGKSAGHGIVVLGGRHGDLAIDRHAGAAIGRLIGERDLSCVVDLSELGSSTARREFMTAFAEALYDANAEPLHLILDEADLWAPQRPLPEAHALLGRIEEIVRRRKEAIDRQGGLCFWCDLPIQEATAEHLVPRHQGARWTSENIRAACERCNWKRGAGGAPPDDYLLKRRRQALRAVGIYAPPRAPRWLENFGLGPDGAPLWAPQYGIIS